MFAPQGTDVTLYCHPEATTDSRAMFPSPCQQLCKKKNHENPANVIVFLCGNVKSVVFLLPKATTCTFGALSGRNMYLNKLWRRERSLSPRGVTRLAGSALRARSELGKGNRGCKSSKLIKSCSEAAEVFLLTRSFLSLNSSLRPVSLSSSQSILESWLMVPRLKPAAKSTKGPRTKIT